MKPQKGRPTLWSNSPQATLNRFGEEREKRPISLPKLIFEAEVDDVGEAAERIAVIRVIRRGRDCWDQIGKAETFSAWKDIGAALAIGREHALRATGANSANGRTYNKAFSGWLKTHAFNAMPRSARCAALELHSNLAAIEAWRETLPAKRRRRLRRAHSNVWAWRRATALSNGKHPMDALVASRTAWHKFVASVGLLEPEQAAVVWRTVAAEAEAHQTPGYAKIWAV